jgi:hypothetical protein
LAQARGPPFEGVAHLVDVLMLVVDALNAPAAVADDLLGRDIGNA